VEAAELLEQSKKYTELSPPRWRNAGADSLIVYQATKRQFIADSTDRDIEDVICDAYRGKTGGRVSRSEVGFWKESLDCMAKGI
jgi:hypothetical protein